MRDLAATSVVAGRQAFFFEKKNQKTFEHWRTPPDMLSLMGKSFLLPHGI
jgi:hypothetical protein